MELRDDLILLRPMEAADEEPIIAGLNDPEVARFMALIPYPYTAADAEAWLHRCRTAWADGSSHPYAIGDAGTGDFLGSVEVRPSNGVIGYWVMPHARDGASRPEPSRSSASTTAIAAYG